MKRKLNSDRGFTLAELLIVVAIIGVLVAISIPIFTSQLERSREAVDLSDVRSAYAEVMMAAITGDTSATYTKDSTQSIYKNDGTYSIIVQPLKQQKDDWQTPLPITIGGVSSNADQKYWRGVPGAKGYCEITYHPATSLEDEYVSFYWTGGKDNGNNPDSTPVPTQPILPTATPEPTPTTGADDIATDWDSTVNTWGYGNWPEKPTEGQRCIDADYGQIIRYGNDYYIVANAGGYHGSSVGATWNYFTPASDGRMISMTKNTPHTWKDLDAKGDVHNLTKGDIYIAKDGSAYVYNATSEGQSAPNGSGNSQWIKVSKCEGEIWYWKP